MPAGKHNYNDPFGETPSQYVGIPGASTIGTLLMLFAWATGCAPGPLDKSKAKDSGWGWCLHGLGFCSDGRRLRVRPLWELT